MIDLDIIENFILSSLTDRKKFDIQIKENAYKLMIIIENLLLNQNRKVNKKMHLLLVITSQHHKKITFDII